MALDPKRLAGMAFVWVERTHPHTSQEDWLQQLKLTNFHPVNGVDPVDDVAAVVTVTVSLSLFLFFFGGGFVSSCRGGDFLFLGSVVCR